MNCMAYQIVIVFVVYEILLGEKIAESRVAESVSFIRAELKHSDGISDGQIQPEDLTTTTSIKDLVIYL